MPYAAVNDVLDTLNHSHVQARGMVVEMEHEGCGNIKMVNTPVKRSATGSPLTPIAAPIALVPARNIQSPTIGRISPDNINYGLYRDHLRRTIDESFALFLPGH